MSASPSSTTQMEKDIAVIKSQTADIKNTLDEIKKGVVWKDAYEERNKGVDARLHHVQKKIVRVDNDLDEHKKENKRSTEVWVGVGIAIVAIVLSAGAVIQGALGG